MLSMKATLAVEIFGAGGRFGFPLIASRHSLDVCSQPLYSFTLTASRVVDSVHADLWIIERDADSTM
jgi:hypothetical protein